MRLPILQRKVLDMNQKTPLMTWLILLLVLPVAAQQGKPAATQSAAQARTDAVQIINELQQNQAELEKTQKAYQQAAEKMAGLYASLNRKIEEAGKAAAEVDSARPDPKGVSRLQATMKQLMEMNQSFNLQYLGLQQQMQDESRRFSLLSNIMKTKHDTAKNSISNLR